MQNQHGKQAYVSEFLSLNCSGDILNISNPLGKKPEKEITEAMAVIRLLRKWVMGDPPKYYKVVDFCSGNALVPLISAFLLPVNRAIAVDKKKRERPWHTVRNFNYIEEDIYQSDFTTIINNRTIITAVHACGNLARRVIDIYRNSNAAGIILMPCCYGMPRHRVHDFIRQEMGKYKSWCLDLAFDLRNPRIYQDKRIMSPKNVIIWEEQ